MMNWYYLLTASFVLLAFLLWKEWKRKNKSRLFLRLSISVIAVASLLALSYPPSANEEADRTANKIVILTNGFSPDSLKTFAASKNQLPVIYSNDISTAQPLPQSNVQFIPDLAAFFAKHVNDTIHVFGNGFTKDELSLLNDQPIIFHAAVSLSTTSSVHWKQQLKTGEPLIVQGKYNNVSDKEIKLFLQAFNETLDSVSIQALTQKEFSLTTIPKHADNAVYSLIAKSGKDTLQNEPLPLIVQPALPLKILILSSSPDFEKTFLKNRLSQHGYEITVSTAISKNKKDEQFINMPQSSADKLNASYLDKFDILIADDDYLARVNSSALTAIRNAIEEKGMGLIVKMNNEKNSSTFYSPYFSATLLKQDKKSFSILHSSINDSGRYKIKIEEPVTLRLQNETQSLLQDDQSNVYAANTILGQGRIVATTLNNTYTLALAGNNKSWLSLWSLLLDKAAKKITPGEIWAISPEFTFVNKPSSLTIESGTDHLQQAQVGNSKIYLKQDSLLPYKWQGTYWPAESGWQSLIHMNGDVQNWYAYNQTDWRALINYQKREETKKYVAAHPVLFIDQPARQNDKWTSHIKLYLVILFFICCSALWIEQKLA